MTTEPGRRASIVVVHSSDEMYGADRMLLQVLEGVREHTDADLEVWLPDDVEHGPNPLCTELSARGFVWRHCTMPVLRRAYLRPRGLLTLVRALWSMRRELRGRTIDQLYCGTSACLLVAVLARRAGVPSRLVHIQERWSGREARLLRWLARSTTCRVAISETVSDAAELHDPHPIVIHNGVDDATTRTHQPEDGDTTPDDEVRDGVRFIVASRWNRWKGHGTLVRAWELAGCPGTLVVLGAQPAVGDGVDVPALVGQVVSRPESVEIVGEVADAAPYIAVADALILPSDEPEPFGLVVIEAFSLSRPVIASRAGGPLEIIEDGVNGWLYDLGDADALADVLCSVTRAQLRRAGVLARTTYESRYTPQRFRGEIGRLVAGQLERERS